MSVDGYALEVEGLVKRYGDVEAVAGVSFAVPRGSVFCLLGPNGAGKTTTLETAQGIRTPTAGSVRVFGEDPRRASHALKRRISTLPQHFSCFELLTVRENLQYWADVYDADPDLDALMRDLGLQEYAAAPYRILSGGTKRRVGIAAALVNDPELVFLDEPTAGVDPASRRQLWDVIHRIRAEGRSVVLTTHYMDEAERLSDEIAIIRKGRIIARGTPEQVRLAHGGERVVRIVGLSGRLPPALASRAGVVRDGSGALLVPLADAADGPLVIAELVKSGVPYRELSIREPSLDDAFVRLVEGEEGS